MYSSISSAFSVIIFSTLTVLPLTLSAQTERELGAHNHGEALLNIVIEGDQLVMLMTSPAANIVGFEHHPETQEQKAAVAAATFQLEKLDQVIAFNDEAECLLVEQSVHWHTDEQEHQSHEHDKEHDHDKEHEHKKEHEHDHDKEHMNHDDDEHHDDHENHKEQGQHSEFEAEYLIRCQRINELEFAAVTLFNSFTGVNEVRVEAIFPSSQTLNILTPQNNRIEFLAQ